MPDGLTFILPTRNRRDWVERAIDSCLQADNVDCPVHLLIIDGGSTDGSFEQLLTRYGNDRRVEIVRQSGATGFMPACFLALPMVKTPLATFMYDDDVLSPFWFDLPETMNRLGAEFAMGFGAHGPIDRVVKFVPVARRLSMRPSDLLHNPNKIPARMGH